MIPMPAMAAKIVAHVGLLLGLFDDAPPNLSARGTFQTSRRKEDDES